MPPLSHRPGTQLFSRVDTTADGVVVPDPALGSGPDRAPGLRRRGTFHRRSSRSGSATEPAKPAAVEPVARASRRTTHGRRAATTRTSARTRWTTKPAA